jgi:hypothetical protein
MNHIIRLTISAPVSHALVLRPLAEALMIAIGKVVKERGVEALMDLNMNAVNPKSFQRNWDKRQREIAEETR